MLEGFGVFGVYFQYINTFFSDALDAVTVIFQPIDYSCLFCLLDGMNINLGYVRLEKR